VREGLVWSLCGALPVAAVAPIWSSYYYLFAMFGAALVIGALLARLPRPATIAILVAFATLSARAAQREEFATVSGSWTTQSHVTPFYISRSAAIRGPLLDDLRSIRPTLPPRSTIFFSSVPANIGWQVGDGPFVRWAYRDTSLRSYFLSQFSYERAHRGPVFFFNSRGGHLSEMWQGDSSYAELAASLIIDDHPECSRDAIRLAMENGKADVFEKFLLVWLMFEQNRPDSAKALLAGLGIRADSGRAPEFKVAVDAIQRGDSLGAIDLLSRGLVKHPLDFATHGLLADLLLRRDRMSTAGEVEAYASRVLAPNFPWSWRRWTEVQINGGRYRQAAQSLDRYFALRGPAEPDDPVARSWQRELRRRAPGGDLVQSGLRQRPGGQGPPR
jgi:hypothetical protein